MLILITAFFPILFTGFIFLVSKAKKGSAAIEAVQPLLIAFLFALGLICFFEDNQTVFHCYKDSLSCEYWRSTIMRPKLRFVRSYDLNDVAYVGLKKKKRRRRHSTRIVYQIIFHSGNETAVFPKEFSYERDAAEEVNRLNRFLQTDKKEYLYKKHWHETPSDFDIGLKYSFFLTTIACVALFIYDRKKKTKIKQRTQTRRKTTNRKKISKEDDLILKNRDDDF